MRFSTSIFCALLGVLPAPATAQDDTAPPEPLTVTGSVTLASDYRFRGVSQTDTDPAIQGGLTLGHESGFYIGTWASNLSGWGTFGGANMELDLIGGFKTKVGEGGTLDIGLTWYMYSGGLDESDFAEAYAKLSGTAGPATLTASVYYAPKQEALGNFSNTPFSRGQSEDNLYLAGDAAFGIPGTPVTLKGHIGYSEGNPGLGPNGTSVAPTGEYWDWALGADVTWKMLTFNVSYVDTDIGRGESAYLLPNFARTTGGCIACSTIVASVTAAF